MNQQNKFLIFGITLVAALGGLLFGYDTAVISGTTGALDNFFIKPLFQDTGMAREVIFEYKIIISLCVVVLVILASSFLTKLYNTCKGAVYTIFLIILSLIVWYFQFWDQPNVLTETMASSIKGFTISSALVGCIIGGALGGSISGSIGRKQGLIVAALLFTISALGSAIPDKLNFLGVEMISSLIFYRIIGGIGVGIASMLSPMYIAEIGPRKNAWTIGITQPICHYIRYVGGLFRQLLHCRSRRYQLAGYNRLALDVCIRIVTLYPVFRVVILGTQDPSFSDAERQ